jgi:hypothetical protein
MSLGGHSDAITRNYRGQRGAQSLTVETNAERRVWELLSRDFIWEMPVDFPVKIFSSSGAVDGANRLQIFEVATAAVFARLRPDYDWYVTPNRPDGGLDFIGRQHFLEDEALGIAAAITVGGQCKKRNTVNDIVAEVAGSLARMAATINPTFFVVALSARLAQRRVDQARKILERTHQRHCHILERGQIEGLFREHLGVVEEILLQGLLNHEVRHVLGYFTDQQSAVPLPLLTVATPDRVLAGVPFSVDVMVRSSVISSEDARLWWRPDETSDGDTSRVTLIGPIGADSPAGVERVTGSAIDDPIHAKLLFEFVSYSVGELDLGEVLIGLAQTGLTDPLDRVHLGRVRVVENVRPRFFERPFRAGLTRLSQEYERALAVGVASIAVVGVGGSGKSRMCEEFSLERRRRGSGVVSAKQTKTLDDPHRLLADLLLGVAAYELSVADPAAGVIQAVAQYDPALAVQAEPAIRSAFGAPATSSTPVTEQSMLSALLLLIVARGRRGPFIIHLQDLHWCTADVLLFFERLVWQLEHVLSSSRGFQRQPNSGVLFIFEGRIRESLGADDDAWTSEPFEMLLQRLDCVTVSCAGFEPEDGLEFTHRLFEDRYSARRLVAKELLELQDLLIERIHETAGGNPFHTLAQVQLLKERHVIGQNPETGLLYMIQPEPVRAVLPDSVFESIRARWQYLRARAPELALLIWAVALLEDRVPTPLFRRLRSEFAPAVSLSDVESTDLLWTGEGDEPDVSFRHENYFKAIRRFDVSAGDRERVVGAYSDWYGKLSTVGAADRFRWGRALLASANPDVIRARSLFNSALRGARRSNDIQLARRIASTSLDLAWAEDARSPTESTRFLRNCDDELDLTRDLLGNDLAQAARRLDGLRLRLSQRALAGQGRSARTREALQRRQLTAEVLRSQILFNSQRPLMASAIAAEAVRGVRSLRGTASSSGVGAWETLEMEALHTDAVALALSGDVEDALRSSERAVEIARRSNSPLTLNVISTYANILLTRDPGASELILRQCLHDLVAETPSGGARNLVEVHLSMALVIQALKLVSQDMNRARSGLAEAEQLLSAVFRRSFRVGQYPDAGAAALMLGIVSALVQRNDEASWFAQAVAAASRGRQMETLWRAHINLATALYQRQGTVTASVRDHALAAFEIMEETLSPYPQPDRSARFQLLRMPLAHAVRFLILAADEAGPSALERYPALRRLFHDPRAGVLIDENGDQHTFGWLQTHRGAYMIY